MFLMTTLNATFIGLYGYQAARRLLETHGVLEVQDVHLSCSSQDDTQTNSTFPPTLLEGCFVSRTHLNWHH